MNKKNTEKKDSNHKKIKNKVKNKIKFNKIIKNKIKKRINFKIIGIIIILLLTIILVIINFSNFQTNDGIILKNPINNSITTVTIIKDPNCLRCNPTLYALQIKKEIIPNLKIINIKSTSKEGKRIIKETKSIILPIFLFSENINKNKDWGKLLKNKFEFKKIHNINIYMIKPEIVPNKILIKPLKILKNAVVYGNSSAKLSIFEFSDYQCPYCAIAVGSPQLLLEFKLTNPNYISPINNIIKNYVKTGKVKLIFYNTPIEQLHPKIIIAHLATLCAKEEGINKWKLMHDLIFKNQLELTNTNLTLKMKNYAKQLNLNLNSFNKCLDSKKYNSQINSELEYAKQLGIKGKAPYFFIGKIFIPGAQDYKLFKKIIDSQLLKLN